MSGEGRWPSAVTASWRRLLWLPVTVLAISTGVFVAEDLPASARWRADAPGEVSATGRVLADGKVRYRHPGTEQEVTADLFVWNTRLVPEPGASVALVADRDDPLSVVVEGDHMPVSTNLGVYTAWVMAAAMPAAMRRWTAWRTERLIGAPEPSFTMLAAVGPSPRRRTRCDLHLYALDAPAGAGPLCSVPLLTTARAPIGAAFPVEVKGPPRPLGRVVVRADGDVLWPRARARSQATWPRPGHQLARVGGLVAAPGRPGGALPAGIPWAGLAVPVVLVTASAVLVAITAVSTLLGAREARPIERTGPLVTAEVVAHEDDDYTVVLRYQRDGADHTTAAPADFASDYPIGVRYPARLDPDDPERARLLAEPYDATEPVAWAAVPLVGSMAFLTSRLLGWRRNRRVAEAGPFWLASTTDDDGGSDLVIRDVDRLGVCRVPISAHPCDAPGQVQVVVAGDAQPGAPIALWRLDGTPVTVTGPATNDVTPLWPGDTTPED